jgi:hypothetical protein
MDNIMPHTVLVQINFSEAFTEFWSTFTQEVELLPSNTVLVANCRRLVADGQIRLSTISEIEDFDQFVHSLPGFTKDGKQAIRMSSNIV